MKPKPYDYARKTTAECDMEYPLSQVAGIFINENIGSVLVRDKAGRYVGLLTDKVFFNHLAAGANLQGMKVSDLKLEPLVCVDKNAGITEVMRRFKDTPSGRLAMMDKDGSIVGILKRKNIERFSIFKAAKKLIGK